MNFHIIINFFVIISNLLNVGIMYFVKEKQIVSNNIVVILAKFIPLCSGFHLFNPMVT